MSTLLFIEYVQLGFFCLIKFAGSSFSAFNCAFGLNSAKCPILDTAHPFCLFFLSPDHHHQSIRFTEAETTELFSAVECFASRVLEEGATDEDRMAFAAVAASSSSSSSSSSTMGSGAVPSEHQQQHQQQQQKPAMPTDEAKEKAMVSSVGNVRRSRALICGV
jgi:hypothetical protein